MRRLTTDDRRHLWLLIALTSLAEAPPAVLMGWAWHAGGLGWGIAATVCVVPAMVTVLMTGSYLVGEFRRDQVEHQRVLPTSRGDGTHPVSHRAGEGDGMQHSERFGQPFVSAADRPLSYDDGISDLFAMIDEIFASADAAIKAERERQHQR